MEHRKNAGKRRHSVDSARGTRCVAARKMRVPTQSIRKYLLEENSL